MKKLIGAAALVSILASPALAQSYRDLGTGNIAAQVEAPAYAQVCHGAHAAAYSVNGHGGGRLESSYSAYDAVTPFGSPANAATTQRDAAIRECSGHAAAYEEGPWGTMQIQQYRACMAQHGQAE